MVGSDDILTTILRDTSTCSRCFAKAVTTQKRGALGHTPCSDNCGSLGLSMESDPIPYSLADRRANNLLTRLEEHDITVDADAFKIAVEKNHSNFPPEELFLDAIEYGLGNKDPAALEPDPHDVPGQPTGDENDQDEEMDPIDYLAEAPVSEPAFGEIDNIDDLTDCVDRLNTPDSMVDIIYISRPRRFADQVGVDEVGKHGVAARADAAVHYNHDTIKSNPQRGFGRWIDEVDEPLRRELLSAAILQIPSSLGANRDSDHDPLRESAIWPVVKERMSQRLLGLMQRSDQDYFTMEDLCGLVEFRNRAVERVIYALETNNTIKLTKDGWVYSGDEVEFDAEQAQFWQDDNV